MLLVRKYNVFASLNNVGDVREADGDHAGALRVYEESLEIRKRLAVLDPANAGWARSVFKSLIKIGTSLEGEGRWAEAAARYAEAIEKNARLIALDPGSAELAEDRRVLQTRLAAIQDRRSRSLAGSVRNLARAWRDASGEGTARW